MQRVGAQKQCRKCKSHLGESTTITAAATAAYEALLKWVQVDETIEVMLKRSKRTPVQYNKDLFWEIATTEFREAKHNMWFKAATVKLAGNHWPFITTTNGSWKARLMKMENQN